MCMRFARSDSALPHSRSPYARFRKQSKTPVKFALGLLLTAAFAALIPARSVAQPAAAVPDVIVFTNGDHLTGKFLRSLGGNAVFHSDIAGDVAVSWDKVQELHTTSSFVVIPRGAHFLGRKAAHAGGLPEGVLAVKDKQIELQPAAASPQFIPLPTVDFIIDQPTFDRALRREPGILSAWSGSINGGASLVQATQDTSTYNAAIALARIVPTVTWLSPRNRTLLDFRTSYGKISQTGQPTEKTSIYHADAERDEYFSTRFYALAQAVFDHNYSQSLDLQQIYGGGIGDTLIKRPNQSLDIKATVQYERQIFLSAAPGENMSLVGSTFTGIYRRRLLKGAIFNQQLDYIPAWNNLHAYSVDEADTLILPVYKRLGFSIGTVDSYLNNPAATVPPTKRNSFQFTLGVAYTLPPPH